MLSQFQYAAVWDFLLGRMSKAEMLAQRRPEASCPETVGTSRLTPC